MRLDLKNSPRFTWFPPFFILMIFVFFLKKKLMFSVFYLFKFDSFFFSSFLSLSCLIVHIGLGLDVGLLFFFYQFLYFYII